MLPSQLEFLIRLNLCFRLRVVLSRGPSGSWGVGCGGGINKCSGWSEAGCRGVGV
jgi:hypothetical protein